MSHGPLGLLTNRCLETPRGYNPDIELDGQSSMVAVFLCRGKNGSGRTASASGGGAMEGRGVVLVAGSGEGSVTWGGLIPFQPSLWQGSAMDELEEEDAPDH